jgi:hypothetical protein
MLQNDLYRLKRALEPLDSSRVVHLSAVAAARGSLYDVLTAYPRFAGPALKVLRAFPVPVRNAVITTGLRGKGIAEDEFLRLPLERLPELVVSEWSGSDFPGAIVGAPLGPVAYLSAMALAPFLTTSFLFGIRDPKDPDDYAHFEETARRILEDVKRRRPQLLDEYEFIFHYDPVHDRFLVRWVTHLRLRLKRLPQAYEGFLRVRCRPDGIILTVNCDLPWAQVDIGDSAYLQVGGLGAIGANEFLSRYPVAGERTVRPESEWGTPPLFANSVHLFTEKRGLQFAEARVRAPGDFSEVCFDAFRGLAGADANEVALDCFTYLNPLWLARKGIAPFWLPFPTRDALELAGTALAGLELKRVFLDLVPSFAEVEDIAMYREWQEAFSGVAGEIVPIGVSPAHYPADPYSAYMRSARLRALMRQLPDRPIGPVSPAFLSSLTG